VHVVVEVGNDNVRRGAVVDYFLITFIFLDNDDDMVVARKVRGARLPPLQP
jgi:hypothetical protein